ncbi:MAG: TIGR01777 family oxidoreductase [Acidobacteriota bacterium]
MTRFERSVQLPASVDDAFAWHTRRGAFDRMLPPWVNGRVIERYDRLENGARLVFEVKQGPMPIRWVALHEDVQPPNGFVDVQEKGPLSSWRHQHLFEAAGDDRSRLVDRIDYRLPFGPFGALAVAGRVRSELDRMFAYRHRTLREDLATYAATRDLPRQRVAVTGSTGLIGKSLVAMLRTQGHEVLRIVRRPPATDDEVGWDESELLAPERLGALDAWIDLAGENIASGSWTDAKKEKIQDSRAGRVGRLVDAIERQLETPPRVWLGASAIGRYGDTGEQVVDDDGALGEGFLADVVRDWEAAHGEAKRFAERVVLLRTGVVLSPAGGALPKLLMPGVGPLMVPGDGRQLVSWIGTDDVAAAYLTALLDETFDGAYNLTAPGPVTMSTLVDALSRVVRRPVLAKVPETAIKVGLGEMARETVLASTGAAPRRLLDAGYQFRHETLDDTLRHALGRLER